MKILQVVPYFPPSYAFGGPAKVVYEVAKELAKRKHDVVVYTSDANDIFSRLDVNPVCTVDGIKIRYVKNVFLAPIRTSRLFITPQLVSIARGELERFDVIHLHEYRSFQNVVVHHYAVKYGLPYVLQAHGELPRTFSLKGLKWVFDSVFGYRLLENASKIVALNQIEAQQCKDMRVPKAKIDIVPNGLDFSEYSILPPRGRFKRKFGIDERRRVVLYLGRIHWIKGIDCLVKAYAHLIRKFEITDSMLVIGGPDDGYLGKVRALIDNMGLKDSVLVAGPLYGTDKLAAYVDAEVYTLPSRYETFPMTILEAYACGKPVIASRVGGIEDLVLDKVTGLLFDPGDTEQLARCLFDILNNSEWAKEAGLKGKCFAERNFSLEDVVDKLERLYGEVIEDRLRYTS
jgi:glycosyltransferase involved in cell wall biosynthesis